MGERVGCEKFATVVLAVVAASCGASDSKVKVRIHNAPSHQNYLLAAQDGDGAWVALALPVPGEDLEIDVASNRYGVAIACDATATQLAFTWTKSQINAVYKTKADTSQVDLWYPCFDSGTAIVFGGKPADPDTETVVAGVLAPLPYDVNDNYRIGVDPGVHDIGLGSVVLPDAGAFYRDAQLGVGEQQVSLRNIDIVNFEQYRQTPPIEGFVAESQSRTVTATGAAVAGRSSTEQDGYLYHKTLPLALLRSTDRFVSRIRVNGTGGAQMFAFCEARPRDVAIPALSPIPANVAVSHAGDGVLDVRWTPVANADFVQVEMHQTESNGIRESVHKSFSLVSRSWLQDHGDGQMVTPVLATLPGWRASFAPVQGQRLLVYFTAATGTGFDKPELELGDQYTASEVRVSVQ